MSRKRKRIHEEDEKSDDSDESYTEDEDIEFRNCDSDTRKELEYVRNEIALRDPDIVTVLNTPLLIQDKAELLQLYEVYTNLPEDISIERMDLRKQITIFFDQSVAKYKQYNRYTEEEHKKFKEEFESFDQYDENEELKYDILKLETGRENKQVIYNEYKRMTRLQSFRDDELPKIRTWLKWAISLPHDRLKTSWSYCSSRSSKLTEFLQGVSKKMDQELYGMAKVKEQILIFLNSRILNPSMKKCSLGLIGPPGCGKTTIVKLLSDILQFPLEQISLGGVQTPEFLKGHQYTYIGAEPGEIVKRLVHMGVKNGILFFDEYDKISDNKDVCSTLLHITDSSQNSKYRDNFLSGITIDLSHLWFFYSMNSMPTDIALADRIFYVNIEAYTQADKFFIVRDYLIRKTHYNLGWEPESVIFEDKAIYYLIEKVSPPSIQGIRTLDYAVIEIANKINFLYHHQNKKGKLAGFNTSFDINIKITFPFLLTQEKMHIFIA